MTGCHERSCGTVFLLGVSRMYRIRNEYIGGTVQVEQSGDKDREARLRWF